MGVHSEMYSTEDKPAAGWTQHASLWNPYLQIPTLTLPTSETQYRTSTNLTPSYPIIIE